MVTVVVVDDSAFMRKAIATMLEKDPRIKVVATARNGEEGLEKIRTLQPDVVTLDIEMPKMDGLDFLERLMRLRPMPVVMVSSLTERGSEITMRALELGGGGAASPLGKRFVSDLETARGNRQDLAT